jgi:purine-nucleoside phosphorylase
MLGSQANILLGSYGALKEEIQTGEKILPIASYGNESATRMYQRDNDDFLYQSDEELRNELRKHLKKEEPIHTGNLMTVQAMLGETPEDVQKWSAEGYYGVDMESATLFAISDHFNVPSAALLYSADNLVRNELVMHDSYKELKEGRTQSKKENIEIAFKTILKI